MSIFSRTSRGPDDLVDLSIEFGNLHAAASERLTRYQSYRDEQNVVRAPDNAEAFAQTRDYGRKPKGAAGLPKRHEIRLPLGKAMTVKHSYRIAGRLPDVVVDQRDSSKQESHRSDVMEKIVWAIIRASRGDTTLTSAAWDASEVGAACLDIYFDEATQMPLFRRIDPAGVIEVQGVDDPHDFERVFRFWEAPLASIAAQYREKTFRGEPVDVSGLSPHKKGANGQDVVMIVSVCDREKVTRFACGAKDQAVVGLYEYQHGYGFTPYVVIPNIGPYEDVWGWGDYEFVRSLVSYLPLLFSREADILKAVANGGMVEYGTGQTPEAVAKVQRDGGVLPSKREGKVVPIEAPDMPAFHETHSQHGMEFMKMLSFTPDAAWGLGSAGSGTDRGLQLQPLLEYTAMKQMNWAAGLSRMFGMAFKMIELKMVGSNTYRGSKPGPGGRKQPFVFELGPSVDSLQAPVDGADGIPEMVELPRTPKKLFDGDYEVRFNWRNRVDPDDPQYVMSELNKFQQGIQSLETTLANLGVQAPEDEMKRIEAEAERFPWVNQGLVTLLLGQIRGNAQGQGGGAPVDQAGAMQGAMQTMMGGGGGQSGALNADAGAGALDGGMGQLYGGA